MKDNIYAQSRKSDHLAKQENNKIPIQDRKRKLSEPSTFVDLSDISQ